VSITFTPSAIGARVANLTFTTNAASSPDNVALTGTGVPAFVVSLSPASLSFGSVGQGVTSASQTATLTNTGPAAVTITSVALTGANASDFAISNNSCGASLLTGSNCVVSVTFTPLALGARTASLTFTTNASSSPDNTTLSGTGVAPPVPAVTLSPTSLAFGSIIAVVATSSPQSVTLTNSGTAALTISSVALTGANAADYFISLNACGASLAAGSNCTVSVIFAPLTAGAKAASLTFTTSAATSPDNATLSGTGVPPFVVSLNPTSAALGSVAIGFTSSPQTVTLSNVGPAAVTIVSIAVTGANVGDFAISANTCGASIAVGSSCAVDVTFTPLALNARAASLTFVTNALSSPNSAALSGVGVPAPVPAVSLIPASITFGSVLVGASSVAQHVILTDSGSAILTITSIGLTGANSGDFTISANTCGGTLGVGLSCIVDVKFVPTATSTRTASLTFQTNAASSPNSTTLSGTGVTVIASKPKKNGRKILLMP